MIEHEKNQQEELNEESMTQEQESTVETAQENTFKDQYFRLNADFQNFKRRVEKERLEWMSSAQANILKKILPVFDELDQVIALAQKNQTDTVSEAWLKGLELSQKNWQKTLLELGVEEISTSGMFNPELHEALMQEEVEGKQQDEIIRTFSKGYTHKGNVIKHAKVSVAK